MPLSPAPSIPLLQPLLAILEEMKAADIEIIDVRQQTAITDYMVICSGRSSRHVQSIAQTAYEKIKHAGLQPSSIHGMELGDWVLIDFGDCVLHVMQPAVRAFYNLEALWQEEK